MIGVVYVCWQMVREDEDKFNMADENKDGQLSTQEFSAFNFPYNHPRMHQLELNSTLRLHDSDRDGKISYKEYLGEGRHTPLEKAQLNQKNIYHYFRPIAEVFLMSGR